MLAAPIWPAQSAFAAACPAGSDVAITVDNAASYCELCGVGQVTVRVGYADDIDETNPPITRIVISEDLSGPGLVPVPNTTVVSVGNGPAPSAPVPAFSGGVWTWDFGNFELEPDGTNPGQRSIPADHLPGPARQRRDGGRSVWRKQGDHVARQL